jgi:hypothetical protein
MALLLGLAAASQLQRDLASRFVPPRLLRGPSGWRLDLAAPAPEDARLALLACVAVALVANAFVCGGLSGAYDRYQARLTWLLPLAVALAAWPQRAPRTAFASAPT